MATRTLSRHVVNTYSIFKLNRIDQWLCAEAKNDGPAVTSRVEDPNSGNVDTFKVAGVAQADAVRL